MSKTTSMQDIANQLNISINAVSIALNDKEGVSNDLRIQILETAVDMNYPFKKLNAKNTLKNKTLIVMIENKKAHDIYYLDLFQYIKKDAQLFGYRILTQYYDIHDFQVAKSISEHHVAGVIVLGKISDEMLFLLRLYIHEIICINHSIPYFNIDTIITHDFLGGYMSCDYLIKRGCKQIGFIGDIHSSENFKKRYDGYRKCIANHFTSQQNKSICLTQDIEQAIIDNKYQLIQSMLQSHSTMPDGFVCVNDRNAAVLIKALQYNGYKVPQDIQVIGFDNMKFSHSMKPSLTTLEVSRQQIAKKVIRRINEMIRETTTPETIMLAPKIIERESTK